MEIFKKLLEAQKKIKAVVKDSTNPHFNSKYFDINSLIAEIKPILNEQGLLIMQPLVVLDGHAAMKTVIIDAESGESCETTTYLPEDDSPQKMGSAITYFRRYALTSLLLLEAEDDDGNFAADAPPKPVAKGAAVKAATSPAKKACMDCGKDFVPKGAWAKVCTDCYRKQQTK